MKPTMDEKEKRKKYIFDAMSERAQQRILKKGYAEWDPFQEPKDPIDIRKDKTNRTSQMLIRKFLQESQHTDYSNAYGQGVLDICLGIINDDDRYRAMYDFSIWYKTLLDDKGI